MWQDQRHTHTQTLTHKHTRTHTQLEDYYDALHQAEGEIRL